ncbi:MAG: hypothetical protein ABID87_07145 [Chloroflexota bacterium]
MSAGSCVVFFRKARARGERALREMFCSADHDCPTGFVCENGRCVAAK